MNIINKKLLQLGARIELARREFFFYCNLKAPDFYKRDRKFLVDLCNDFQNFYESEYEVMIINLPPRHGKSRTAGLFVEWALGKNQNEKIMTGSYNETLSTMFSKNVRNDIQEAKADLYKPVYADVFPGVKIKPGDGAMNLWSLEGGYNNYLATSPTGTATGFGASLLIIDDLIKNAEEANNELVKDKHWDWFCFTGDTLVKTPTGDKMIKDVVIGDNVLTFNHSRCKIEDKMIVKADSHLSSIYKLEFENGQEIECTDNHKFYTTNGYLSVGEILSAMRCTVKEGETVLFSDLQKQSQSGNRCNHKLHELWEGNTSWQEKQTNEILFYGLQKSVQSEKRKRSLCKMGKIKRYLKNRVSKMPKVWGGRKFTSTPHRPQYKKQPVRQFDSFMPIVPYRLSQITRLPSNELHRVYDIEVADNHNFFANDMLVHNCNTMLSRLEEGGKIIIIMTRWASNDLAGRALNHYQGDGKKIKIVSMQAIQKNGTMLCSEILSLKSCESKKKAMGLDIWSANYQQEPIDLKGRLYNKFKTYSGALPQFREIRNYTDTADTGEDYLCSINYGVTFARDIYVLSIIYTKEPMEVTEPATAKMLHKDKVNVAVIESNNGGRGFARSVERILFEELHSNRTSVRWFHQSKNKIARILSNATWIMEHVYFPEDWKNRWPEYYEAMSKYQREGKNKHDDAPDATTGVAESIIEGSGFDFT